MLHIRTGRLGSTSIPAVTGTESTGVERHDKAYLTGPNIMADNAVSPRTISVAWTPRIAQVLRQETMAAEQPGTTLNTVALVVVAPHAEAIQVITEAQNRHD